MAAIVDTCSYITPLCYARMREILETHTPQYLFGRIFGDYPYSLASASELSKCRYLWVFIGKLIGTAFTVKKAEKSHLKFFVLMGHLIDV
ncbi:MAG TPA: hypothetical protein PKD17_18545 [Cellvibrionaceae bacterium]|nr:hypothetical protein [Cellvibrionaceae bacterium]HMW73833.1 hypothetical protein [Cellvibrionaceae bacterium]